MADKPTKLPAWATDEQTDPVSGQLNRVEPPSDRKASGWQRREIPPRQWWNWLLYQSLQWFQWLKAGTPNATANTVMERNASGRTKVAQPSANADAANKGYVDTGDADTLSSAESYTDGAVGDLSGVTDEAAARGNLGLGLGDTPAFSDVTLSGRSAARAPASSSDPGLSVGTWRTPNANRPTLVTVSGYAHTEGLTDGIQLYVDETGGTNQDYFLYIAYTGDELPSGTRLYGSASTIVPAGGSYQVQTSGSNNGDIEDIREFTL